jgi:glucose dehydrogenase
VTSPLPLAVLLLFAGTVGAQTNWSAVGQDEGATKYSTLAQITTANVATLERAWTFHTGFHGGFFESTPLVIDGVMYVAAGNNLFALDASTGAQIWRYATPQTTRRGVAYWPGDAQTRPRIVATTGTRMIALDARTGVPVPTFGAGGFVNLGTDAPSPPAIYKNLLITPGGSPVIRAWDAHTGRLVWTFNLVAQPGDPAHASWENDAWRNVGGTNVWGYLTVDAERGIVYAPNSIASNNDYVGVNRPGNNLYGTSLVAIDANTGKLRWYQQYVHHDIWDYDLGAAPTLFDVVQNGRRIPAVAQMTKMGLLFVHDRTDGRPLWGIEERPVPRSDVPGEKTSPTQPFPVKPPPLARNSMKRVDLPTEISPAHTAYCQNFWDTNNLQDSAPYQPWGYNRDVVVFPGSLGGGNLGGVTFHAPTNLIITNVMNVAQWGHVEGSGMSFRKTPSPASRFWDPRTRYTCAKPPWGELIAVNGITGDIAWRVPLGIFEELEARGIKTGTPNLGGAISTAGNLVFIGATIDSRFRAFDARTGRELWMDRIEAPAHSIPSTFMGRDGKQYVAVVAGGGGYLNSPTSDVVIAYRLK